MTALQWDIAFAIYVLHDCNSVACGTYLKQQGSGHIDILTLALEHRFLQTNMQILTELNTGSGAYARCHNLAQKFLVEFNLSVWLQDTCAEIGMAPSSDDVYQKYALLLKEAGLQVHHQEGSDSWRKWVSRWRKK